MIYIKDINDSLKIFQALSSPVRLQILSILHDNVEININELSQKLNLSNGALTSHIKQLSDCGLIKVRLATIPKGIQKLCSLAEDKIIVDIKNKANTLPSYNLELNVGQYSEFKVNAPCGLGTQNGIIGGYDSEEFFSYPDRFNADIAWFTNGQIKYVYPKMVNSKQKIREIQFTLEVSAEAPGASMDYPSIIEVLVNNVKLGDDFVPGEQFDRRGKLTPLWWKNNFGQYGWLKLYSITEEGSFFSGEKVSDITIDDLNLDSESTISLTLGCKQRENISGGITLFGKKFGDHDQGIKLKIIYDEN